MLGYIRRANPNAETSEKWEGKTVSFNGSEKVATVVRAYWQGPGKAIQLRVLVHGSEVSELTDSEHVVITREV